MTKQSKLAYRLNKQLLATAEKFVADHSGQVDIYVLLSAANLFLSGLIVSTPSRQIAIETLAKCHEAQKRMLNSVPGSFFGRGLLQNPELN